MNEDQRFDRENQSHNYRNIVTPGNNGSACLKTKQIIDSYGMGDARVQIHLTHCPQCRSLYITGQNE